jgi:hypothetical protein
MVDVSAKAPTRREAEASAFVAMTPAVLAALPQNAKGDPLEVARIAGIMAAKRTSELIPMCHPLPLALVDVDVTLCENGVTVHRRSRPPRKPEWKWKLSWLPAWQRSRSTICARRLIKGLRFARSFCKPKVVGRVATIGVRRRVFFLPDSFLS